MSDTLEPLIADLLAWIGSTRPYLEVMDAWRTSCPRLPVWEEANQRGLVSCQRDAQGVEQVSLTEDGRRYLRRSMVDSQAGGER
jgi:D-3-phosphoglycerate dehydrogenase